jgi:predicted dithiol-disulfide oxidoreductase (DUF899 family)
MPDSMIHTVVSHEEWLAARTQLLADEKQFTLLRDRLNQQRRALPWEAVDTEYVFEGPNGRQTLAELFDGRSQLVVYHAMFNPDTAGPNTTWTDGAPCFSCSYWMDNVNGAVVHLNHRDITMVAVSRAPYPAIMAYRKRMGWGFPWLSSAGSNFNFDYRVSFTEDELASGQVDYNYRLTSFPMSEAPGASVFFKDGEGHIFHTYSTYARGLDMLNVAYHYMDLVPKGRDERGQGQSWVRRHDEYED